MQNDYITYNYLKDELKEYLVDGTIDKILMPEFDEIILGINTQFKHYNLFISANANFSRIHITKEKKNNPFSAFQFCMYLRKIIHMGKIKDIKLINFDRIFDIEINSSNELKDSQTFHLVFENMGRFSNIFILNEKYTILNALKTVPYNPEATRDLFNGATYVPPRMQKTSIQLLNPQEKLSTEELNVKYSGFTKKTANELVFLMKNNINIQNSILSRKNLLENNLLPVMEMSNNQVSNFYIYKYNTLMDSESEFIKTTSLSEAIEKAFSNKSKKQNILFKLKIYIQLLDKKINKLVNAINNNNSILLEHQDYDNYRICGDILISSLYKENQRTKTNIILENIYDDMKPISISLDQNLSLKQNAEKYYKLFNKYKRQSIFLVSYNEKLSQELHYLEKIKKDIELTQNENDIDDIHKLFLELNLIEEKNKEKTKNKKPKIPNYYYELIEKYDFYMGKNAIQNEYVTFKIASSNDLWLHAKNYHGAHGVIISKGQPIDIKIIEKCAKIVAKNSECKNEDKVEIDYTQRKNVKKDGNKIGLVYYTNYKTITVKP